MRNAGHVVADQQERLAGGGCQPTRPSERRFACRARRSRAANTLPVDHRLTPYWYLYNGSMHNPGEERSGPRLLSTWVQPSVHERLAQVAKEHNRSLAGELRTVVRDYLERQRVDA